MFGLPLAFSAPWALLALLLLPVIWFLLRLTPPKPQDEVFPPLVILNKLATRDETPAKSPWWLTLLRLALAALLIGAMAGPIWNPRQAILQNEGPILLVVDDGWASGEHWDIIRQTALDMVSEAENNDRLVSILMTTDPNSMSDQPVSAADVKAILEAASNRSTRPDHQGSAKKVREALSSTSFGDIVYLSDGLQRNRETEALLSALGAASAPLNIVTPNLEHLTIINKVENQPSKMVGTMTRAISDNSLPLRVDGFDKDGLSIAQASVLVPAGTKTAEFEFTQPVELRNQIVRVEIENASNAGAVQLLDDSNRRRIVGLISGQSADISQPLLSPLYYIKRALSPFSDLRDADTANLDEAAKSLIAQKVSAIVLADVGTLPPEAKANLTKFVEDGGLIIRFAGPRLAANPEGSLLPVDLVQGDRFLGGALSWDTPKAIAPFDPASPFFGLPEPKDITVSRQVLAVQSRELEKKTWARLEDGTPLITADRKGAGWIVLFHVNSDNNWSNLPLSGSFVEMLRRTINLSHSNNSAASGDNELRLPPLEVLDGKGLLSPPQASIKPLVIENGHQPIVTIETPPGLYGTQDGYLALNLGQEKEELAPLDVNLTRSATTTHYAGESSFFIKPWLLLAAAALFLLDCLAVLWFAGVFKPRMSRTKKPAAGSVFAIAALAIGLSVAPVNPVATAHAQEATQDGNVDFSAALRTRFAFVKTGSAKIDRISEAGLLGLTRFVSSRTALEPADPIGIDISVDELSFYPFLYWPIDDSVQIPDEASMARVDAYMKQGGTILFDTRDAILGGTSNSSNNLRLREILASLDIPPLEPVPSNHVLTKSFFLLDGFPGRYQGGDLWVEQIGTAEESIDRPARAGDGVSTIMITSNDFAGAWAIDNNNRSLFPTVPPSQNQREYAFRVGVNIVMYTLTGNYKADQVHIPALLERLGQ